MSDTPEGGVLDFTQDTNEQSETQPTTNKYPFPRRSEDPFEESIMDIPESPAMLSRAKAEMRDHTTEEERALFDTFATWVTTVASYDDEKSKIIRGALQELNKEITPQEDTPQTPDE